MQNVTQNDNSESTSEAMKTVEVGQIYLSDLALSSSSDTEKVQILAPIRQNYIPDLSPSDEEEVSEVESFSLDQDDLEEDTFLLSNEALTGADVRTVDPDTQARLEALLDAAGIGKLSTVDGNRLADPEVLRRLTSSVSCALDEAAAALTRMRTEQQSELAPADSSQSLAKACMKGDVNTVRQLLKEGRSVHETTEEGESLLSLACSAGYYELAQLLLAMKANVEDRGVKGDCTPLMEAASGGCVDIVKLLINHGADVNAQSSAGNTSLHYAACGGHEEVVRVLINAGANVEEHNENGHTPLMETATAGHITVAKILLVAGAGVNTHSNEFKESALTLACYKGHLKMAKFLLAAGADQEHKTDEMHTALMEASMDGHVDVARLLLDSGAQVNMPADSFESPLTLAACGGHVELANLLIERGANLEEVNDEGYTPLMEAAREGHEEMVALLLAHGADINAQTEETQETALTLACCGGFLEVADFLIKADADLELGCSTPLMEAAQEGHIELVKYLMGAGADVHAETQTGDTSLTYACENGHTDVAKVLLERGAKLEHQSEGGRTPLMKAARAGHLCTVQFLINEGADVNQHTSTNDHSVLSLACAGGHLAVVEMLLRHGADPTHKLKDGSTMLIEAAKGGHVNVVNLLLDWPNNMLTTATDVTQLSPPHSQLETIEMPRVPMQGLSNVVPPQDPNHIPFANIGNTLANIDFAVTSALPLPQVAGGSVNLGAGAMTLEAGAMTLGAGAVNLKDLNQERLRHNMQESLCRTLRINKKVVDPKNSTNNCSGGCILPPPHFPNISEHDVAVVPEDVALAPPGEPDERGTDMKASERLEKFINNMMKKAELLNTTREEQIVKKQQILEELQKVEAELHEKAKAQLLLNVEQKQRSQQQQLLQVQLAAAAMQQQQQQQGAGSSEKTKGPSLHSLLKNQLELTKKAVLNMGKVDGAESGASPTNCAEAADSRNGAGGVSGEADKKPALAKQESLGSTSSMSADSGCGNSDNNGRDGAGQPDGMEADGVDKAHGDSKGDGRAGSEDVDLSNVMPFRDKKQVDGEDADSVSGGPEQSQLVAVDGEQPQAVQLQQQRHLQQQKQQLQAQLVLQQQLQHELQQQLQLQQEHQQLQQQLKAHQVQMQLQQQDLQVKDGDDKIQVTQVQLSQDGDTSLTQQQQQQQQQQDLVQQLKLQQVQQHLQQLHHQLQHVQQLQNSQQMTQQELLQQAYQLQLQLQQAQQLQLMVQQQQQPAGQQNQVLHQQQQGALLLTQQELLQQAQQLQQEFELGTQQQPVQQCVPSNKMLLPVQLPLQQLTAQPGVPAPPPPPPVLTNNQVVTAVNYTTTTTIAAAAIASSNSLYDYYLDMMTPSSSVPLTPNPSPASPLMSPPVYPSIDLDAQTESNHDTALTLACAGGHTELVGLLLTHGAEIEHRDKKGFTPLILAATAGHADVVEVLLENGADIEAQSERTKDTPLSLACSGGRYEVVELLLARGANKEHRNVSDYTPLSLAASGGYVNIIKLLLSHGAEINSRTGSKLGISPLMLAAMNGHTNAVKLLLDMGSDINAQIETNRNTALTLACFQGRHEVVSLLVDRRANIEHRAKTGLTPLMEAASGGYVEVGRVLLEKGADVNAPPVPSSRDTALTIAADKGHNRFVDLLLSRGAAIDVKNKKGNSPLWLACNGGHAEVVHLLVNAGADVDSQDNRKVSCLMAAFRKGHVKVVKWLVKHVMQFPSDQECVRYIATVTDKELLKKCNQCMDIIVSAKDRQAAEANKNASILLEQIDQERSREESKRAAAARKREKRRKKKKEKQEKEQRQKDGVVSQNHMNGTEEDEDDGEDTEKEEEKPEPQDQVLPLGSKKLEEDSVPLLIEPPNASTDTTLGYKLPAESNKRKPNTRVDNAVVPEQNNRLSEVAATKVKNKKNRNRGSKSSSATRATPSGSQQIINSINNSINAHGGSSSRSGQGVKAGGTNKRGGKSEILSTTAGIGDLDDFGVLPQKGTPGKERSERKGNPGKTARGNTLDGYTLAMLSPANKGPKSPGAPSPKKGQKKEEDWKEVIRKSKKITVSANQISRVIGRGGSSINAIREVSGAHIEVDKQKSSTDRVVTIRGSAEATRQAHNLITALIRDSDRDIEQIIPRLKAKAASTNTLTMATNVWHNSMANSVSSTMGTASTGSPLVSRSSSAVVTTMSTVVQTTQMMTTMGQVSAEISTHVATGAWGNATFPPLGRVSASKSAPNGSVVTGQGSKTSVSRQLFPQDKAVASQQQVVLSSAGKTIAMYTSPATTKTKVVSTAALNPAAQVDVKVVPSSGRSLSKVPGNGRHPPGVQVTKIASEPQLLPMLPGGQMPPSSSVVVSRSHVAVSPASATVTLPPGEYSPFNNFFSKVAENVIGKKNEQGNSLDNRMNFASVAASGVMAPSGEVIQTGIVAPPGDSSQDESLQAKAPGYKAPGQRSEAAPGYKGGVPQGSQQPMSAAGFPYGVPPFPTSHLAPMCGSGPPMLPEMNGGMPGMGFGMPTLIGMMPSSMDPGGERHSPRLDAFGFPHSVRDEYSTQDRPMTLPKIDSNLNPNAPNFTSMFLQRQHREQCAAAAAAAAAAASHMVLPPGNMNMAPMMPGGPDTMPMPHPAFRPPMQVGTQKPFNGGVIAPPPVQPPIGNAFHQVPPSNVGSMSDFTAGPSLSGGFNPLIGSGPFVGTGAATTQPPPKQFSPLAASSVARSSSTPSSVGASSKDGGSPVPPASMEVSPVPSSTPSPTDHMRMGGDDRRLPRPIGTERSLKKPPLQPGFSGGMGDAPSAASIWTFQNELGSSWMSSVTSVVTSSIMTSSIGTAGLRGVDTEEQRPHSQPAMPSSAFPSEPIVLDKSYPGHTALLMPGSGPGVYGNPIDMSTLYAQSAESLPAMWNPSLKPATGDIVAPESKMVWTDWARQPDM